MLNYLTAEIKRIISKKSTWYYFIGCFLGYLLIVLMRITSLTNDTVISDASFLFASMLPLFAGTMLFSVVYNDDLTARTLPQVVGFGLARPLIILVKTCVLILITALVFLIGFIIFNGLYFILGVNTIDTATKTLPFMLTPFLQIIGYSMVASVVVYGTQRATMAIVAFLVFASSLVPQLLNALLSSSLVISIIGNISPYLMSNIINRLGANVLLGNSSVGEIVGITLYMVGFIALAMFVFNKKEMEF